MLNKNTLPQDVQDILKTILEEEPSDLNQDALDFLKARQDYLTNAEKELYFGKKEVKIEEVIEEPVKTETKPVIKQKRHRKSKK